MERKYIIDTAENKAFLKEMREDLVRFGKNFPSPSGTALHLDNKGNAIPDSPQETWITARMAHVYSIAHMLGCKDIKELAQKAVNGLRTALHDNAFGGWYSATDNSNKECYAHAFVILAASSAMLAHVDHAEELLEDATEVFDRYFWEEEYGLVKDSWDRTFTNCAPYRGLNAAMHSVEALLAVCDATGNKSFHKKAGRIIEKVIGWARNNSWRIPEHFSEKWEPLYDYNRDCPSHPFKPYGATPGHGLEWARLIVQHDAKNLDAAVNLFDRAVSDGWAADGKPGFVYTTDWDGRPIVHDRNHWTLAEGINTAAVLYRLTGDGKYSDFYAEEMAYLDNTVLDHTYGSWFHQLDKDGNVLTTVWSGKRDLYHAFQATLIPYADPAISIASAVLK